MRQWNESIIISFIIYSGNDQSPAQRQAITWINADLLATEAALGTNVNDMVINFSLRS